MTVTADRPQAPATTVGAPVRVSLKTQGVGSGWLDGAWWPRSRELSAELPALVEAVDPVWGRVTRITVNPTLWTAVPGTVAVRGHTVHVGWFQDEQNPHVVCLLSYGVGRWDLLVVPPETPAQTAAWLMAAATDPRETRRPETLLALTGRVEPCTRPVPAAAPPAPVRGGGPASLPGRVADFFGTYIDARHDGRADGLTAALRGHYLTAELRQRLAEWERDHDADGVLRAPGVPAAWAVTGSDSGMGHVWSRVQLAWGVPGHRTYTHLQVQSDTGTRLISDLRQAP